MMERGGGKAGSGYADSSPLRVMLAGTSTGTSTGTGSPRGNEMPHGGGEDAEGERMMESVAGNVPPGPRAQTAAARSAAAAQ